MNDPSGMNKLTRPELRAAIVPAFGALMAVLTAAMTGGGSLAALAGLGTADRAAEAATMVDAQRLTRVAALIVMSLALVVRLRAPRRTTVILDWQDSSANAGHLP